MTIKVQQIEVSPASADINEAFGDRSLLTCGFCEKTTTVSASTRDVVERLSGKKDLFCKFCIRNELTGKNNRHTLILTFRGVFGYLYHTCYKIKKKTLYHSQLVDFARAHEHVGLTNPVFKYDPETFLWFVNFEKVGSSGRKIPLDEVKKTVANVLSCFNLSETIPGFRMHQFYKKYSEALDEFYTQRKRPEGKRILSPTVTFCGPTIPKDSPLEKTRDFLPREMVL